MCCLSWQQHPVINKRRRMSLMGVGDRHLTLTRADVRYSTAQASWGHQYTARRCHSITSYGCKIRNDCDALRVAAKGAETRDPGTELSNAFTRLKSFCADATFPATCALHRCLLSIACKFVSGDSCLFKFTYQQ